jgi:predicted dehydrogenase
MKKLRVGVIGVGYLGRFHAEKYAHMDNVELVGVVDVNRDQAQQVAETIGVGAYSDYRELFGKVDAVSVVVPTHGHFEVGMAFLKQQVDVLIEKPITTTIEEADALIRFAAGQGLIIQVGHLERFNPAVLALEGIVKIPRFIESHRLSIFRPRGIDVSVVLDLMIHDIDIILNMVKSEVTDIRAAGTAVITPEIDIANARLEFNNGCVANVTASRISLKNERKIRLFQRDAYISVDFANHEISVIRQCENGAECAIPGMDLNRMCFPKGDALDAEIRAFVSSVMSRKPPEVSGKVGRDALNVALSIMEQIHRNHDRLFNA